MANLLPFDVICDILVRLPVKSLIRFKCVCKSWYALIENSYFIEFRRKYSLQTSCNLSLIFTPESPKNPDSNEQQCSWIDCIPGLHQFSQTSLATRLYLPPPFMKDYHNRVKFVGSCNGLICVRNFSCLALINPSTRMFKLVPYFEHRSFELTKFECYGFGYDCQADDYKIVGIAALTFMVYSLRTHSWRSFRYRGQFPRDSAADAVFVNGRLHWPLPCQRSVLSFDLHDEQFHRVALPNYDNVDKLWIIRLGVLDGCLCVTFSLISSEFWACSPVLDEDEDSSDVWVMKEYGNQESWTKLCSFPFTGAIPLANIKERSQVLFSRGCNEGLFLWNTEKKTMREIEGPAVPYSQVAVCLDTLAPRLHDSFTLQGEEKKKEILKERGNHKEQEYDAGLDRDSVYKDAEVGSLFLVWA